MKGVVGMQCPDCTLQIRRPALSCPDPSNGCRPLSPGSPRRSAGGGGGGIKKLFMKRFHPKVF